MVIEAATLLTVPPGSLVYHLILITVLALIFSLAQAERSRRATPRARRWVLAGASLLTLRIALLVVAGLAWLGVLDGALLLPPLNQLASLTGVLVLGWVVLFTRPKRSIDAALAVTLTLALLGLAATLAVIVSSPASAPYNQTWPDILWTLAGAIASLILAILLLARRPAEWGIAFGGPVLLAAGFGLHTWSLLWQSPTGSLAGFVRMAELGAYPLFALAATRALALERLPESEAAEAPARAPVAPHSGPSIDVESGFALAAAESANEFASQAVRAVSRAMRAEYSLLLTPPDASGRFSIAIAYDLISEQYLPGTALDDKRAPVISAALTQRRTLTLQGRSRSPDMQTLQFALNLHAGGPALMVPMVAGDELQGGLLVLSPYARHDWTAADRGALEAIAQHLARRQGQIRLSKLTDSEAVQEALAGANRKIEALTGENERLASGLGSTARGPARPEELGNLLALNEEARETIQILEAEIERLKRAQAVRLSGTAEEVENLADQLQIVLQQLAEARARLAALEAQSVDGALRAPLASQIEAIAAITQEMRLPLASMADDAEVLIGESLGSLGPMQRKFVDRFRGSLVRMKILFSDLDQASMVEPGTLRLASVPVDILECIKQALIQTGALLRTSDVTVRLELPDDLPPALGDQNVVIQFLIHLINNAAAVSPQGGEVIAGAKVQGTEKAGEVRFLALSFTDSGPGIPPEDLGRVFERRRSADAPPVRGIGDRGVGLVVVKALVEALGGRVWVESQVGVGSTYWVLLPLARAEAASASGPAE